SVREGRAMTARHGKRLLLLVLGLGAHLGCATLPQTLLPLAGEKPAEAVTRPEPTLPAGESADLCVKLAATLEKNGRLREAAFELEKARGYNPRLDLSYRLALLYDKQGEQQQAPAEFQKAVTPPPP